MPFRYSKSPRLFSAAILISLICQLWLVLFPLPALAQSEITPLLPKVQAASDLNAGLQDLVGAVSADNIVQEVAGISKFSRCANAPTHSEAASYLQERLKALHLTPIVQSFTSNAPGLRFPQLQNIAVRFPGSNPQAVHLVTAHYDSSPNRFFPPQCDGPSPGANDNGSGVSVLLELARLLGEGRVRFKDDIELVFFDGEEFGYLGSQYLVQNFATSDSVNPLGLPLGVVVNMDMVGYVAQKGQGKVWAVAQPGASLDFARQGTDIAGKYWSAARYNVYTIGDLFPASRDPNRQSDQQSFWNAGKGAAIFLTEDVSDALGADPRYHTPGDVLYNQDGSLRLDSALMADTARVAIAMVGVKATPQPGRFFPQINLLFEKNWSRADRPVLTGAESGQPAGRSWLWGPSPNQVVEEPYADVPGGTRVVTYFDKARMEVRLPGSYITNGLLVREMATGALQLGDTKFEEHSPSQVPVAGDPNQQGQNPNAPTYASFKRLVEAGKVADATGQALTATVDRGGQVGVNNSLARYARNATYIPNTGHNVADVFWNWFQTQGRIYDPQSDTYTNGPVMDWLDTVGFPISEAYWVKTRVAGVEKDVLVQLFERRVLTYTPSNDAAFQVEMGNVGLHYYSWRYGGNN